jgi:endoglucanase
VLVLGSVVLLAGVAALVVVRTGLLDNPNPFAGRDLYVDPESEAIKAVDAATDAATRDAFLTIADQPTAIWLTPEEYPAGEVGPYVAQVLADAEARDTLPVFVVYGIPDRDCGQFSAGGTTVDGYETWVREIATALEGTETPVILEPDSIQLAEECGDVERRLGLVSTAGSVLTGAGATVYLDGGHSNWHSVQESADLLRRAGVADVHGFATNVSNYNDDASELAYAQRLSAQLDGAPFVVDTGRNGNGSDGTWCNPAGAALGAPPLTLEAEGLDANLWVKPPGESDGTCGGGPGAGQWWPDRALSLVAGAR